MTLQRLHKLHKRLLWRHRVAHAIVEYHLLAIIRNLMLSILDQFIVGGPILIIGGLISPGYGRIFLGVLLQIEATKLNISGRFRIA